MNGIRRGRPGKISIVATGNRGIKNRAKIGFCIRIPRLPARQKMQPGGEFNSFAQGRAPVAAPAIRAMNWRVPIFGHVEGWA